MAAPEYINLVLALAARYQALGHKILCVADRVEFLRTCASHRPKGVAIVGGGSEEERERLLDSIFHEVDEIYGTTSIFKEGISRDILSCLILGAPTNNEPMLEQLIGRIQRPYAGKQTPRIVDIKLDGWTGHKQFQTRLGLYMRLGLKVNYL
jgi:superfamily II DNA or RNA helicase